MAEALAVGVRELEPELVERHFLSRGERFGRGRFGRRGTRRWQYRVSSRRAEGRSSVRPLVGAKPSAGRSVHDAGTAVRCPLASCNTTHGSSSRQKKSRKVANSPPTWRRCLPILTTVPGTSKACGLSDMLQGHHE